MATIAYEQGELLSRLHGKNQPRWSISSAQVISNSGADERIGYATAGA